jgi:CheY-like chemotaxis protein
MCAYMDSRRSPTPHRILIVDDDPVSLAIASVLLEAEGCAVVQAESGDRALELLAGRDGAAHRGDGPEADAVLPECILADLRMPGISGTELARRLRASAPHALLLAMSASPPLEVEGYDGVVKKPLEPEALAAALTRRMPPRSMVEAEVLSGDGPVLDNAVFERLRHAISAAALEEVISTFLNDTRARIETMRSADAETMRREAHTVKGGAAMVGALQVSRAAAAVESGIDDPGARLRKLDEMEAHCRRAEVILKQRLEA